MGEEMMLTLGILFGLAGLVLITWHPITDAIKKRQAKKIMGDMRVTKTTGFIKGE
jgi:hypothetical protein